MTAARYLVYARDVARRNLGEIPDYAELLFQPRFNDTGGWHLTASASSRAAALLTKTGGIVITRNNLDGSGPAVVFSGPVTTYNLDAKTLEVAGSSDELVLAEKAASPDPTTIGPPSGSAYATEQDLRSGTASTVMLAYVKYNAISGFAATSASGRSRAVPGLALGTDLGIGTVVYGQARWISLLALMQDLALAGGALLAVGSLRFQVLQSSTASATITFSVSLPTDRSATAVISRARGTLGDWKRTVNRPSATVVYTLGQGEGINRLTVAGIDAAASTEYGYEIEAIDDRRDVSDALTLLQANGTALSDSGEDALVTFTPIDTTALTWGVDYDLGDLVRVVTQNAATGEDETLVEIVRGVDVTLTAPGENAAPVVKPIVSTPGDTADDPASRQQRAVTRRVSNLERNVDSLASALAVQWNIGDLRMTTRAVAAAGWLLCRGQAVSRVTYSGLYGVIGTTYGAGDGSTTFNLPDFRDRVPVGAGSTYTLGTAVGAASVSLAHGHSGAPHSHTHNHTSAAHSHSHSHSHSHTGAAHTHSHSHTGAAHTHSHTHTSAAHTHTSAAHSHSHTHTSAAHSHIHAHGSAGLTFTGSGSTTGDGSGSQDQVNVTTPATQFSKGTHTHSFTPAGSIGGNTATDATSTTPGATGTDATSTTPADTGSTAPGATGGDATAATYTTQTGTDTTPASFSTQTGTDATTDATSTTPGATGSDATAASFSDTTGASLGSVSLVQPSLPVTYEIYTSV